MLLRSSLYLKVLLYTFSIVVSTSTISSYILYQDVKTELESNIANELLGIVQSLAVIIDSDLHENIFYDPVEGGLVGQDAFTPIQQLLVKVSDANNMKRHAGLSPLYTLRPSFEENKLEFVVMTNTNESGQYFTGALIDKREMHNEVLNGQSATSGIYTHNG